MSELLPCPFCGDDGRLVSDDGRFCVVCASPACYCAVGEEYDQDGMPEHRFFTEEAAVEAWNSRRDPAPETLSCGELAEPFGYLITYAGGEEQFVKRRPKVWPTNDCKITRLYDAAPAPCTREPGAPLPSDETRPAVDKVRTMLAMGINIQGNGAAVNGVVTGILEGMLAHVDELEADLKCAIAVGQMATKQGQRTTATTASAEPVARDFSTVQIDKDFYFTWPSQDAAREAREKIAAALSHMKLETYRPTDDPDDYAVTIVGQSKAIDAILAALAAPAPIEAGWLETARKALSEAEEALRGCYQVADWPADGSTSQDMALASVTAALDAIHRQERGGESQHNLPGHDETMADLSSLTIRTSNERSSTASRCPHCDDTGDVHRADGEWLGSCDCKSARNERGGEAS